MDQSIELNREVRGLKNDRLMTERAVDSEKGRWAEMLRGSVGADINDVLSGRKKVRLTFKEWITYKWRYFKSLFKKKKKETNIVDPMYGIRNLTV